MPFAKLVLAAGAAIIIAPAGASANKPSYGCSPPYTEVTIEEATQLERSEQAVADGLTTAELERIAYSSYDTNGDGVICYMLPHGFELSSNPYGEYLYGFVDNNSSAHR